MLICVSSRFWVALCLSFYKAVFPCYWIPSFLLVGEGRTKYELQQCTKGINNVCENGSAPILKNKSWALLFPIKYQPVGYQYSQ